MSDSQKPDLTKAAAYLTEDNSLTRYRERLDYFVNQVGMDKQFEQHMPAIVEELSKYVSNPPRRSLEIQFRALNAITELADSCTPETQEKMSETCKKAWKMGQNNPWIERTNPARCTQLERSKAGKFHVRTYVSKTQVATP